MKLLMEMLTNQVLVSTVLGWFFGQGSKLIVEMVTGKFSGKRLIGGGGMPSGHSATMAALVVSTALACGVHGHEFVISLFFAIIVVYDAAGVRYETGEQAKALNEINRRLIARGEEPLYDEKKPLEETMGHTWPQIFVGLLIGLAAAVIVNALWP